MSKHKSKKEIINGKLKSLLKQIVLAVFIATAVEGADMLVDNLMVNYKEKKQLDIIDLGVSQKYIVDKWGSGKIIIKESDERLREEYFNFENHVVRVVYDEEKVVAYFITNTTGKNRYKIKKYGLDWKLFDSTYSNIKIEGERTIEVGVSGAGKYHFYNEIYGMGNWGSYASMYYAIFSYGDLGDEEKDLVSSMQKISLETQGYDCTDIINNDLKEERLKAKPNTIGFVSNGYENKIINPDVDTFWLDICRIITNFYEEK